jgi:glutathione S-transferase
MNIEAHLPEVGARVLAEQASVRADLARIVAMWTDALQRSGGPFLFGDFGTVDAFYAPVVTRLRTYALPVPPVVADYMRAVLASPGVAAWEKDALAEHRWVAIDEPYRPAPAQR